MSSKKEVELQYNKFLDGLLDIKREIDRLRDQRRYQLKVDMKRRAHFLEQAIWREIYYTYIPANEHEE